MLAAKLSPVAAATALERNFSSTSNGAARRCPAMQPGNSLFWSESRCHSLFGAGLKQRVCPNSRLLVENYRVQSGSYTAVGEAEDVAMQTSNDAFEMDIGFREVGGEIERIAVESNIEAASLEETEEILSPVVVKVKLNVGSMDIKVSDRALKRKGQQAAYLCAAVASSMGFTTLSAAAVFYRFVWQMPASGQIPYAEVFGTFSLAVGAAIGMEYWARWAHKALWHASLWNMHESHHKPREGPFETNDVFAIINAVPAIALMLYGFLNNGLVPGLCFGAGLGITMFGMAYMFVHDGLVHRRFPVGPIAGVPYLQKVAAAHQLHHADLFHGVPYGLFLGPKELEHVGGEFELEKLLKQRAKK